MLLDTLPVEIGTNKICTSAFISAFSFQMLHTESVSQVQEIVLEHCWHLRSHTFCQQISPVSSLLVWWERLG